MAFDINTFKTQLKWGGARASLFQVQITNPADGIADLDVPFHVKASSLPAATITKLELHYMGRSIPVAGNRTFEPWQVTIYNDEDFKIRNAIETWSNMINGFETNVRKFPGSDISLYKSTALITQFSQTGDMLRTYKMVGVFPTSIGAITTDWENDTIQTFDVQFEYDYWVIDQSVTGDAGGE
jgi:hypothetical protein